MEQLEPYGLFLVFGMVVLGMGSLIGFWVSSVQDFLLTTF